MESPNAERLQMLIGFLKADSEHPDTKEGKLSNVELAAAYFLNEHFTLVVSKADAYDEIDAQAKYDEAMKA
jgi:hypothetical protein